MLGRKQLGRSSTDQFCQFQDTWRTGSRVGWPRAVIVALGKSSRQIGSWRSAYLQRGCLSYVKGRGIWASVMNGRDLSEVKFSSVHIVLFFFYFLF